MLRLAVDGVTSFSTLPLGLASLLIAARCVLVAFAIVVYALIGFMTGTVAKGWTSMALITVFFATAQLACLGVLGPISGGPTCR